MAAIVFFHFSVFYSGAKTLSMTTLNITASRRTTRNLMMKYNDTMHNDTNISLSIITISLKALGAMALWMILFC